MKFLKLLAPIIVLIVGAGVSFVIINSKEQPASQAVETKPRNIKAVLATSGNIQLKISTQGSVKAKQEIDIVTQVSGQIVYVSGKFVAGGMFDKNEVLLRIDPRDYEVAVVSAQSQVAESTQRLVEERAEAELAISEWEQLGQGEASELTLRKPQLARAEAQLRASEARLQTANLNLERSVIKAPFNGLLTIKNADLGQYLSPGSKIANFHSTDIREVRLPLSPTDRTKIDLAKLQGGNGKIDVTFTVSLADTKTTWKGYVVRTEGMIVNNTDVLWLVAELKGDQLNSIENNAVIDIGQFVDAEIDGRSLENIIVLPREALLQGNTVMVVENGDTLRTRNVIVMEANPEMVVITEGISVGEQINITQLGSTAEGMLVTPILEEGAM